MIQRHHTLGAFTIATLSGGRLPDQLHVGLRGNQAPDP